MAPPVVFITLFSIFISLVSGETSCRNDGWQKHCVPACDMWTHRVHCRLSKTDDCKNVEAIAWRKVWNWERNWTLENLEWVWRWKNRVKWEPFRVLRRSCGEGRRITTCTCLALDAPHLEV